MQDIRIMSVVQSFDILYKVHNCRIYVITCLLYDECNIRFATLHRNFIQGQELHPGTGTSSRDRNFIQGHLYCSRNFIQGHLYCSRNFIQGHLYCSRNFIQGHCTAPGTSSRDTCTAPGTSSRDRNFIQGLLYCSRNFIQGHLYCSEILPEVGGREISLLSAGLEEGR